METGLVMYAASRSRRAIHARSPASRVAATAWALLNCHDADAVGTVGGLDLDLVADSMPEHCLAEGGFVADGACLRVGLRGTDDPVRLVTLAVFLKSHGASYVHDA